MEIRKGNLVRENTLQCVMVRALLVRCFMIW